MKGKNNFHGHNHRNDQQQERQEMFQKHEVEKKRKKNKRAIITYGSLAMIFLLVGGFTTSYYLTPGDYDDFAKCLTEKGVVMYGAIKWCKYTQAQANMFGKSFKYIDYRDESLLEGIKTRPTWVIEDKWYEKVQSFERFSSLTGCKY